MATCHQAREPVEHGFHDERSHRPDAAARDQLYAAKAKSAPVSARLRRAPVVGGDAEIDRLGAPRPGASAAASAGSQSRDWPVQDRPVLRARKLVTGRVGDTHSSGAASPALVASLYAAAFQTLRGAAEHRSPSEVEDAVAWTSPPAFVRGGPPRPSLHEDSVSPSRRVRSTMTMGR
jgi:hypothetical protein